MIRHRSISYAFCIYNKMYCNSQNTSDIFSFDIAIVILGRTWYNKIECLLMIDRFQGDDWSNKGEI